MFPLRSTKSTTSIIECLASASNKLERRKCSEKFAYFCEVGLIKSFTIQIYVFGS